MKKLLIFTLLFCILFVGCKTTSDDNSEETTTMNYGLLIINNMTVPFGQSVEITPTFTGDSYEIQYHFEGNNIEIRNGKVKGLVADTVTEVTAMTEHHSISFMVTVLPDYGTLAIADVYAPVDYLKMPILPVFSDAQNAQKLTFSYDATKLKIDEESMTVQAKAVGNHTVTASSEKFTCEFTVHGYEIAWDSAYYNLDRYNNTVTQLTRHWGSNATANSTVAFIGDSYFNEGGYFSHFSSFYGGKDALCLGIGYSGSYTWEIITENIFGRKAPGAIVMHIGTNNVYNDKDDYATCVASLQRYFVQLHQLYPNAPIYWFNITQRNYENDSARMATVANINKTMKEWCDQLDWITCIETSASISADMLADKVHVKQEYYYIFVDALKETDIVIKDKA